MFNGIKNMFGKGEVKAEDTVVTPAEAAKEVKAEILPETAAEPFSMGMDMATGVDKTVVAIVDVPESKPEAINIKALAETGPVLDVKATKMVCDIIQDESKLLVKSEPTSEAECSLLQIFEKLSATLEAHPNGLGLSAIQIGIPRRAFVMRYPLPNGERKEVRFRNPRIVNARGLIKYKGEGCLSFPDKYVNTVRYKYVQVCDDINGMTEWHDILAVVMQHEIEHCDGDYFLNHRVAETVRNTEPKLGRNDPCKCGSGKKYKKCCLK
jgi:peptide deformylase